MTEVSVALATCNGMRFLSEQLDSIEAQTRLPNELIVTDDASTDETAAVVERFATQSGMECSVYKNERRLGYAQNFSRTLSRTQGEIVFLSDQDDRWDADKIETMLAELERSPDAQVLACDARLVDGKLKPVGVTKLEQIRRSGMPAETFFMGCCMAVRRDFLQRILPIPPGFPEHDQWIATIARAFGVMKVIEKPLQDYRLHDHNQSRHPANLLQRLGRTRYLKQRVQSSTTPSLRASLKQRAINSQMLLDWAYAALEMPANEPQRERLQHFINTLNHQIDSIDQRRDLLTRRRRERLRDVLRLSSRKGYRHFSGWKSAVRDLVRR